MMHASLSGKLGKLAPATKVYCGHEYTVQNLRFAQSVEPDSAAVAEKLARAQAARARGEPTVPSSIGEELATNPFLRCGEPAVKKFAGASEPAAVLAAVRRAKDTFR
jgi:hydroxyacylglutathione hydrolase